MSGAFLPTSPAAAFERWVLGQSQPEDVGILQAVLFDEQGRLNTQSGLSNRTMSCDFWTDAICEHLGFDRKFWHKCASVVFGDRAHTDSPTVLLALLTVYEDLTQKSYFIDDELLWQSKEADFAFETA